MAHLDAPPSRISFPREQAQEVTPQSAPIVQPPQAPQQAGGLEALFAQQLGQIQQASQPNPFLAASAFGQSFLNPQVGLQFGLQQQQQQQQAQALQGQLLERLLRAREVRATRTQAEEQRQRNRAELKLQGQVALLTKRAEEDGALNALELSLQKEHGFSISEIADPAQFTIASTQLSNLNRVKTAENTLNKFLSVDLFKNPNLRLTSRMKELVDGSPELTRIVADTRAMSQRLVDQKKALEDLRFREAEAIAAARPNKELFDAARLVLPNLRFKVSEINKRTRPTQQLVDLIGTVGGESEQFDTGLQATLGGEIAEADATLQRINRIISGILSGDITPAEVLALGRSDNSSVDLFSGEQPIAPVSGGATDLSLDELEQFIAPLSGGS